MKKMKAVMIFLACSQVLTSQSVLADDSDPTAITQSDSNMSITHIASIGPTFGMYQDHPQASLTLGSEFVGLATHNNPLRADSSHLTNHLDIPVISNDHGVEWAVRNRTGYNYFRRLNGSPLVPWIGIDPIDFDFKTSTNFASHTIDGREAHLRWSPGFSVGAQLSTDTCKALIKLKAGADFSTTTRTPDDGIHPQLGAEGLISCRDFFLSLEGQKVIGQHNDILTASLSAGYQLPGQELMIGVSGEIKSVSSKDDKADMPFGSSTPEVRGMVVIGSAAR